uniref:Uncharacterized protein n=1 Tax=Rhizophora mucronata TaxID=61149 RepID=A0A2P2Q1Z9_RHIMU
MSQFYSYASNAQTIYQSKSKRWFTINPSRQSNITPKLCEPTCILGDNNVSRFCIPPPH